MKTNPPPMSSNQQRWDGKPETLEGPSAEETQRAIRMTEWGPAANCQPFSDREGEWHETAMDAPCL